MKRIIHNRKLSDWTILFVFSLCLSTSLLAAPTDYLHGDRNLNSGEDTLRDRAISLVKEHMDDLKNINARKFDFKTSFTMPNPTVPCDYCVQEKGIKLDDYVVDVTERYSKFDFEYELTDSYDEINVVTNQKGDYMVNLNVKKTVKGLLEADNTINKKRSKTTYLVYIISLNYNKDVYGISSLIAKRPPGVNVWMAEINPNLRISNPDFGSQEVYSPNSSYAFLTKMGVVKYFNPFGGVNAANIWFKAGLRVNLINSKLQSDFADFSTQGVELDGDTDANPHNIDVKYNFTDVVEKQTAILLEIPIGFSKRIKLSSTTELSLEAEISYSFPIYRKVSGDYMLDQLGTNHLFNKDVQSESGGSPVIYGNSPQMVLTANGELIEFFRSRRQDTEIDDSNGDGYFTISLRPTFMIRKYEALKYNIGLNIGYSIIGNETYSIDQSYFNASQDKPVKPLHDLDEASGHIYGGIVFGVKF
ncbi:hypothetical protein G3O08_08600 [Cryomorpha ignava]|uniref:Uncharacterized protein n=1 Tax=Cryomorpha ignava TaxID=101383 RepID=A0A7K3WPH4_9FLAO|nr:hypothetical protein [Cryomorpha ignava]NEN23559.1 hypothetical protein [Cryomorpha ignava]